MADDATLRDTVVTEPSGAEPSPSSSAPPPKPPAISAEDQAFLDMGKILASNGVTPDKINDLIAAPQALEAIRYAIENDPKEFVKMLERANPKTADKFTDFVTDLYLERNPPPDKDTGKPDPNASLMQEIKNLREEIGTINNRENQRNQALSIQATRQRLDARVEDLLGLKEVKELGMKASEVKNLRARLDNELAKDPSIVQRVSNGNFVDVPKVFQELISEKVSERKAETSAAEAARNRTQGAAFPEFENGAELAAQFRGLPSDTFDSWDATESALAKALSSAR